MNSTKSVSDKLNFAKYPSKLVVNLPKEVEGFSEVTYDSSIKEIQYDLLFIFIFSLEEFRDHLQKIIEQKLVKDNGYVYFAYPKKNNKKYEAYIDRDSIYNENHYDEEGFFHGSQLKFSRMISLDDVFTVVGMKSIPPKAKKVSTSKNSQCVDDYVHHIEDIREYLNDKEETLHLFNELTPGYQKDWARQVYSAKREETRVKRLKDMETILAQGYKSMDLYRRKKK